LIGTIVDDGVEISAFAMPRSLVSLGHLGPCC
jgi:hypothetical protein